MNRKDILGNEIKSECVGCAIVRGEVKLPGGIIYDGKSIILAADPEIPIPGFLIISSKRHIQSFAELTVDERAEIGNTIAIAERAIKDLKIAETVTLVQEECSKHFHIWIFPNRFSPIRSGCLTNSDMVCSICVILMLLPKIMLLMRILKT